MTQPSALGSRGRAACLAAILLLCASAALAGSGSSASVVRPQSGAPASFGIYGSNTIGSRLMPTLVDGYAARIGALGRKPPAGLVTAKSDGERLPVACNASDQGRDKNRRVEIWLT